jgi:1A family penicillin-binding protein
LVKVVVYRLCISFQFLYKKSSKGSIALIGNCGKTIRKVPLLVYFTVNEIAYFIYSFIQALVEGSIRLYRFITSLYFRYFLYGMFFCLMFVGIYQTYHFIDNLPSPASIGKMNFAKSTHLYDRNGKLLYEIYRDINRTPIKLKDLPPYVQQATIAIEDKNFYSHRGVSFFGGMLRAVKDTLKTNELQGGSTITQQLVKSALLSPERTLERKAKEIILAIWTEQMYNKDQILEMYLNQVPYGGSSYGIEEASKVYFGKSAHNLTIDEAALLAGLPQAPSLYSPFVNKTLAEKRRNDVLRAMYQQGYIKEDQYKTALARSVNVLSPTTNIKAPHFVFFTRNTLEEEFGTRQVEEGGFRVTTSLDLDIQTRAEQILKEELEKVKSLNVQNGGVLVLNPQNGEILAMVGSVDYFADKDGAFNVTTALRQPGSTLKPMLYAMAMERGYTAATAIDDSPIVFQAPGGDAYRPVNYDGRFHGKVTLRTALANSYNIPAVKVMNAMGVQPFVDYAKKMGIDSWQDSSRFGLSLSLGGGEITLLDLAQMYSVFASQGYRVEPTPFVKIIDDRERVILEKPTIKTKVMDPGIAYIISDILSDNNARLQAFGPGSALEIKGHKVSVKTGTSNDKKDNLTVGYTPEFLVAVWVGNNDNTPMNPYLTSGITGAAPIWNRVMKYLLEEKSTGDEQFKKPDNVLAKPCYGTNRQEYFLVGTDTGFCHDAVIRPRIQTQNAGDQKSVQ